MKRVKFYTFGCKANQYDTQVLREKFLSQGFCETQDGVADLYVVNTCVVTQKAENESRSLWERLRRENPSSEILLTGCLKRLQERGKERFFHNLAEERISFFAGHRRVFLKIQDGCDNFCSYCIVPYVRGKSRSKPFTLIKEEFKGLLKNGYKEIVLTGICLGEYGKDLVPPYSLVGLLKELESLPGDFRIRLSSLDPEYINEELINCLGESRKICPHLHIPFQSGDDFILKKMNRSYTGEFAYGIIEKIRKKINSFVFTTDIMVGFPGEEEESFQKTLTFLDYLKPLKVHIFRFSPRPGTPAEKIKERIGTEECRKRFNLLTSLEKKWRVLNLNNFLGKKISFLAEKEISRGLYIGHSEHYLNVLLETNKRIPHEIIEIKVKEIKEGRVYCTL
ncbi:MAG: MiaB/RimO family radical SAM methylthiotransferase [Candidatus Omnitrophota bacterium]